MELLMRCPGSKNCTGCYHQATHNQMDESCESKCHEHPDVAPCVQLCPDLCANKDVICEDCVALSHFKQKENK